MKIRPRWLVFWYLVALALTCIYAIAVEPLPAPISLIPLAPLGIVTHAGNDTNPPPRADGLTTPERHGRRHVAPAMEVPLPPANVAPIHPAGTNSPLPITNNITFDWPKGTPTNGPITLLTSATTHGLWLLVSANVWSTNVFWATNLQAFFKGTRAR